ncbi:TusE/DsrC/DsvC family sulfur relay protein [Candidatus Pyrohabitans sp.]
MEYLKDWNEATAVVLAEREGIDLSERHMQIITYVRDFFENYMVAPTTGDIREELGVGERELKSLFPLGLVQILRFAGIGYEPCF